MGTTWSGIAVPSHGEEGSGKLCIGYLFEWKAIMYDVWVELQQAFSGYKQNGGFQSVLFKIYFGCGGYNTTFSSDRLRINNVVCLHMRMSSVVCLCMTQICEKK